jgi:flagellar biosynthesis GTPase FlhF
MGDGSPVMTEMASKQLMELYSLMDEKGKENTLRSVIAGISGVGWQKVNLFVAEKGPRRTIDFDIANLENGNLRQGVPQMVHDSQNHAVHIEAHVPMISEIIEAHRQQQMADEQAMQILRPAADHVTEHLVFFSNNSYRAQEVRELKRQLQNLTAYIDELEQQVINRMMAQQSEMQNQFAEQPTEGVDPKMEMELQKAQMKLAEMQEKRMMNQETHQQKMETIRQQMALNDLKTRSSILEKTARPAAGGRPPLITQEG